MKKYKHNINIIIKIMYLALIYGIHSCEVLAEHLRAQFQIRKLSVNLRAIAKPPAFMQHTSRRAEGLHGFMQQGPALLFCVIVIGKCMGKYEAGLTHCICLPHLNHVWYVHVC